METTRGAEDRKRQAGGKRTKERVSWERQGEEGTDDAGESWEHHDRFIALLQSRISTSSPGDTRSIARRFSGALRRCILSIARPIRLVSMSSLSLSLFLLPRTNLLSARPTSNCRIISPDLSRPTGTGRALSFIVRRTAAPKPFMLESCWKKKRRKSEKQAFDGDIFRANGGINWTEAWFYLSTNSAAMGKLCIYTARKYLYKYASLKWRIPDRVCVITYRKRLCIFRMSISYNRIKYTSIYEI